MNTFTTEAQTSPPPSWAAMEATLRVWHEQSLNDAEYIWLEPNFEDVADAVNKAMFCAATPHFMDVPSFEGVRAELDALTVRGAV